MLAPSFVLIAAVMVLPLVLGDFWAFQLGLYYLYAIAALGIGVCWGQAGFLPLGQAMFFGLSAYLSGFALIYFEDSWWLLALLPLAALVSGMLAYGIGLLVFRARTESGPYFSLITLAISLLVFQIANNWNQVTGGFNGLKGIPGLPGLGEYRDTYYVAAVALSAAGLALAWLFAAPLGILWRAVAQNERRVAFFGFSTTQLKAVAFGLSGLLGGIAGTIYAPQQGLVTPQLCGFILSADLVIWAAVGGRNSLLGPIAGALAVGLITSELRDRIFFWEVILAFFFIVVVLYFPNGIVGALDPVRRRLPRRRGAAPARRAPAREARSEPVQLDIAGISARVGEVLILDDLWLLIDRPGIFCIIGPNGAGKTSTFNLVTGELKAQGGRVALDGSTITGLAPERVIRRGVGRKFQIPNIFPGLGIRDNLHIALWSGRVRPWALLQPRLRTWTSPLLQELEQRYPFLADRGRQAQQLSHGERQILELAMALITEPRLLLLDEPCAGLSAEETATVIEVIRWAALRLGATIIIIEHDMSLVKELAQHVFVLHQGKLLAEGSVAQIQANPAVQAVYVGGSK